MSFETVDLGDASIAQLAALIHDRQVTATNLVEAYLKRIEEVDNVIHSVLSIAPDIYDQARRCDESLSEGHSLGPLHGIPILIKDHINVAGLPSCMGSHALKSSVARRDAVLVSRLKNAGAIILGFANLSQWGFSRSHTQLSGWSSMGGQGSSPYYPMGDPVGSSSGSGIATAAGLAAAAIGSEVWGSIVDPAAHNCCVGLKPTPGLVPQTGCMGNLKKTPLVYGPITRHVADIALLMDAMIGEDPEDEDTLQAPRLDFAKSLDQSSLKDARVGVVRNLGAAIGMEAPSKEVEQAVSEGYEQAITALKRAGAECIDIDYPRLEEARKIFQGELFDNILAPEFSESFEEYFKTVDNCEVKNMREVVEWNKAHPELEMIPTREDQSILERMADPPTMTAEWRKMKTEFFALCQHIFDEPIEEHRLDVIVAPCTLWDRFSASAGYPEIVVPMGFLPDHIEPTTRPLKVDGVTYDYHPRKPYALSFIGKKFDDARLVGYAHSFEQHLRIRDVLKPYKSATAKTQLGDVL